MKLINQNGPDHLRDGDMAHSAFTELTLRVRLEQFLDDTVNSRESDLNAEGSNERWFKAVLGAAVETASSDSSPILGVESLELLRLVETLFAAMTITDRVSYHARKCEEHIFLKSEACKLEMEEPADEEKSQKIKNLLKRAGRAETMAFNANLDLQEDFDTKFLEDCRAIGVIPKDKRISRNSLHSLASRAFRLWLNESDQDAGAAERHLPPAPEPFVKKEWLRIKDCLENLIILVIESSSKRLVQEIDVVENIPENNNLGVGDGNVNGELVGQKAFVTTDSYLDHQADLLVDETAETTDETIEKVRDKETAATSIEESLLNILDEKFSEKSEDNPETGNESIDREDAKCVRLEISDGRDYSTMSSEDQAPHIDMYGNSNAQASLLMCDIMIYNELPGSEARVSEVNTPRLNTFIGSLPHANLASFIETLVSNRMVSLLMLVGLVVAVGVNLRAPTSPASETSLLTRVIEKNNQFQNDTMDLLRSYAEENRILKEEVLAMSADSGALENSFVTLQEFKDQLEKEKASRSNALGKLKKLDPKLKIGIEQKQKEAKKKAP